MKLGRFLQTPLEDKTYIVDYSQWLGANEIIESFSITVGTVTTPPLNVTEQAVSTDGKSISFFVGGGVDGTTYEVQLVITTSLGQIKNDQIIYLVRAL